MKTIIYTILIYTVSVMSVNAQTLAFLNKKPRYSSEANYNDNLKKDQVTAKKIQKAKKKRVQTKLKDVEKSKKDFGTKETRNYFSTKEYNKQQKALSKRSAQSINFAREERVTLKKASSSDKNTKVLIRG